MLHIYMRHEKTGITVEVGTPITKATKKQVDMRDATMALIDKVVVEREISVVEAMSDSQVSIIAEWKPEE